MKGITNCMIFVMISLIILVSGCSTQASLKNSVSTNSENLRVAEINLPGMYCKACAYNSESSLKSMNGVIDADVDIDTKKGTVVYDSTIVSKADLISNPLIKLYEGSILNDWEYQ